MNLSRLDHVAITCQSIDVSTRWYQEVLGFERVFADRWGGIPVFLKLGATSLALFPSKAKGPARSETRPHIDHIALLAETATDFTDARKSLEQEQIEYVFQDHEVSHSVYFDDPDGHRLEITTYDV